MPYYKDQSGQTTFIGNPGLNPDLVAGKTLIGDTLNSNSLTTQPDLSSQITNPPTPTTPNTAGGQASIDSLNKLIGGTTDTTKDTDSLTALMDKYLSGSQAPASQSDLYTQALKDTGYTGLEQNALTQQGTLKTAQGKLAAINAQLEGLKAEETAIPIRLQEEAQGRGITTGGIAPLQAGELRKVALRAIPLQAQALGAQAEVFAAQGNAELAQNALKIASDKLNTLFTIKSQDATNTYNYWKDLRDKVFEFATTIEQRKLAQQQKEDDRKHQVYLDQINNLQTLSGKFMDSGQADLAAKLGQLDPNSKTFQQDLATIQTQYKPTISKPEVIGSAETGYYQYDSATKTWKSIIPSRSVGVDETVSLPGIGNVNAGVASFAQTYASTGKIPSATELKTAGVTFAQVADTAKALPKVTGMVLDKNTGIAPAQLSNSQMDGISALYDLTKKLDDAKTLFDNYNHGILFGIKNFFSPSEIAQKYNDLRLEISDLLARARTGAAINVNEERIYNNKLPGNFNESLFLGGSGDTKIADLKSSLLGKLQTNLDANGVVINGFSKIKLSDGNEYTIGDVIQNAQGLKGRINADGTITPIQ